MQERVVVTGMGAINPLGHNVHQTWENAVRGVSGVGLITLFDTSDYLVKIACEVKNFNPENFISGKEARRRDRFDQFAAIAAQEAIDQSGITATPADRQTCRQRVRHQIAQSLSRDDGIPVHVCETHAGWRGLAAEDFPAYVDVAPSAPSQIRNYERSITCGWWCPGPRY